jgi:hypothetical protein
MSDTDSDLEVVLRDPVVAAVVVAPTGPFLNMDTGRRYNRHRNW